MPWWKSKKCRRETGRLGIRRGGEGHPQKSLHSPLSAQMPLSTSLRAKEVIKTSNTHSSKTSFHLQIASTWPEECVRADANHRRAANRPEANHVQRHLGPSCLLRALLRAYTAEWHLGTCGCRLCPELKTDTSWGETELKRGLCHVRVRDSLPPSPLPFSVEENQ